MNVKDQHVHAALSSRVLDPTIGGHWMLWVRRAEPGWVDASRLCQFYPAGSPVRVRQGPRGTAQVLFGRARHRCLYYGIEGAGGRQCAGKEACGAAATPVSAECGSVCEQDDALVSR